MNTYVKIEKFDEYGEVISEMIEPMALEHITVALEEYLIDEGEVGQKVQLTVVELEEDEYKRWQEENGY